MDWIQSMTRAIRYIEAHLTHDIGVRDVAEQVYASNSHFQRIFR